MSDPTPEEPPPPRLDPSLLREAGAVAPAPAPAEPGTSEPAAASCEDPELPGVCLAVRVETLLFAASEPLALKRLKELLATDDGRAVRAAIDGLRAAYEETGRAFVVEETAAGFRLRTRPELAPLVARLGRRAETERLSPAALETLAIVAYRQPVLRADVEKIRGVASGEVLRTLVERGLVRVAGRADLPGAPLYYGTTPRFLEVFGLRDLAELPRV